MAIVNQYGTPFAHVHASEQNWTKGPSFPTRAADIDKLITARDARTLRSLSSRLYANMGVPRCAIGQIADFSIGESWLPTYVGASDMADGKQISAFLQKTWFPSCDVRGGCYDWHEILSLTIKAYLRDGDVFWLLVKGKDNFPRIQMIPAHRVGNGDSNGGKVESGRFKGYKIYDGVITHSSGRAAAYRVLTGDKMETWEDVDAANIIQIIDTDYIDQGRGIPAFSHAIGNLASCLASNEDERVRMQIISRLYLTVFNEDGGPELDDPLTEMRRSSNPATPNAGVTVKDVSGGIVYMTAGQGQKMEQMTHQNPSETYNNYIDRMIRDALVGVKWPMALVWASTGQGTAERLEVIKARRTIAATQRRIRYAARRALSWAYSVFQQNGKVPLLDHPFAWTFSTPPRLSVDDGRESKMEVEEWRAGLRNTGEVVEARGMTEEEFYEKRARSVALRKVIAKRVSEEVSASSGYEIEVEDREMAMLTPNEVAEKEVPETPSKSNEPAED